MHMLAGALRYTAASTRYGVYQEVPVQMFALRMLTLGTLLARYRVSPVTGIAALSIGAGYIVGQRVRRPATVNR